MVAVPGGGGRCVGGPSARLPAGRRRFQDGRRSLAAFVAGVAQAAAMDPRQFLQALFRRAVAACSARGRIAWLLPPAPPGRTAVVGAGKAAAAMAAEVERHWPGALAGLVAVPYGHGAPLRRIELVEAAHPVPDRAGARAGRRMLALVSGLGEGDLALVLLSGGGSALLALPAAGIALGDKRRLTRALLASGAAIAEINGVRKHLSAIKGGRLALAAWPAATFTLAISDVPGDDLATVASGPAVADPSTRQQALATLARHGIAAPAAVRAHLRSEASETPKPGHPRLARARAAMVARPGDALDAAAALASERGVAPVVLGDTIEGEARHVAQVHAAIAREIAARGRPAPPPAAILSGGETTVTLPPGSGGSGGRNREFLLALALALDGMEGVHALACDTDGIDGDGGGAGAFCDPSSLARAAAAGICPREALRRHDSGAFFRALGDTVVTGATRTNVNDFRAILVRPGDSSMSSCRG